jgi:hypothetical protein
MMLVGVLALLPAACTDPPKTTPTRTPEPALVAPRTPPGIPTADDARSTLQALKRDPATDTPLFLPEAFGTTWSDVDGNGCGTRDDVLATWMGRIHVNGRCANTGKLTDPYTGRSLDAPDGVFLDHAVGLADAWRSGASEWSPQRRNQFYNDVRNLVPTSPDMERTKANLKGASFATVWLPPSADYECAYASVYVGIKGDYSLTITEPTAAKLALALDTCVVLPGGVATFVPR